MPHKGVLHTHDSLLDFLIRGADAVIIATAYVLVMSNIRPLWSLESIALPSVVLSLYFLAAALFGVYRSHRTETLGIEFRALLSSLLFAFGMAFLILRVIAPFENDVDGYFLWASLSILINLSLRILLRQALRILRKKGKNTRSVLLVGGGELGQRVLNKLNLEPALGLKVEGVFDDNPQCLLAKLYPYLYIGNIDAAPPAAKQGHDLVIIALPMRSEARMVSPPKTHRSQK